MHADKLTPDEVSFELFARGLPIRADDAELRRHLSHVLDQERRGVVATPPVRPKLWTQREIGVCRHKLVELEGDVLAFSFVNPQGEFERISSRLLHVQGRLYRLVDNNPNEAAVRLELKEKCVQLLETIQHKLRRANEQVVQSTSYKQSENLIDLGSDCIDMTQLDPLLGNGRAANRHESPLDDNGLGFDMPRVRRIPESDGAPGINSTVDQGRFFQPCTGPRVSFQEQPQTSRSYVPYEVPTPPSTERSNSRSVPNAARVTPEQFQQFLPSRTVSSIPHTSDLPHPVTQATESATDAQNISIPLASLNALLQNLNLSQINTVNSSVIPPTHGNTSPSEPWKYFDIGRLNLSYDGQSSVTNFIQRVEEVRQSRGVSKDFLFRSASELFTGEALNFWRTSQFSSWDDLVRKLRDRFLPYGYENDLWAEIRCRTQGAKEKVATFVDSIENLFGKLSSKPSEEVRLEIIRRNLLPYLQGQLALQPVYSIGELVRLGRKIEETVVRTQNFQPPPINYRTLLEPALAYHKTPSSVSTIDAAPRPTGQWIGESELVLPDQPTVASVHAERKGTDKPLCWNCKSASHRFRSCDQPKKKFCFKCGHPEVTTPTCPHCQKNGRRGAQ